MPINRFETLLPYKGMLECYYKYDNNDNVLSVGVNIQSYGAWEFTEEENKCLMDKAITHHKKVIDARRNNSGLTAIR
jgi:hypothetical protein